jgi:glutamate racemase
MIGVFDSGIGGLTVLKEILRELPQYDYLYFGDTLHVPYGNRSDDAVYSLTRDACDYLFNQGCRLIIIACNTASAKALRKLQQEYLPPLRVSLPDLNILGVIRPVAEEVARRSTGLAGVIGTRGTVNSNVYVIELSKLNAALRIVQQACPLLVPLIEENWLKRKEIKSILRYYLRPLKLAKINTLILGCTHYPLLINQIRRIMGKRCLIPHPGEIVAKSLGDYLRRHPEIEKILTRAGTRKYVVTDLTLQFQQMAQRFLGDTVKIEKI